MGTKDLKKELKFVTENNQKKPKKTKKERNEK